ncbi:hypothetical protein F4780DRAFT_622134 [Xylariomycetidae sp. FL0641]|nr:hypothetical protein F4780DRAFT_622134 [Xylariomycetidae sp. FL0641]
MTEDAGDVIEDIENGEDEHESKASGTRSLSTLPSINQLGHLRGLADDDTSSRPRPETTRRVAACPRISGLLVLLVTCSLPAIFRLLPHHGVSLLPSPDKRARSQEARLFGRSKVVAGSLRPPKNALRKSDCASAAGRPMTLSAPCRWCPLSATRALAPSRPQLPLHESPASRVPYRASPASARMPHRGSPVRGCFFPVFPPTRNNNSTTTTTASTAAPESHPHAHPSSGPRNGARAVTQWPSGPGQHFTHRNLGTWPPGQCPEGSPSSPRAPRDEPAQGQGSAGLHEGCL